MNYIKLAPPTLQNEVSGNSDQRTTTALLRLATSRCGRAFLCLCLTAAPLLAGCGPDDVDLSPPEATRLANDSTVTEGLTLQINDVWDDTIVVHF